MQVQQLRRMAALGLILGIGGALGCATEGPPSPLGPNGGSESGGNSSSAGLASTTAGTSATSPAGSSAGGATTVTPGLPTGGASQGGAGGMGGTTNAGSAAQGGAGGVASGSGCADHGYVLCESFEGALLDENRWRVTGQGVKLASEHAARGSGALEVAFTPGGGAPVLELKELPEALQQHHFGRFFAWSQEPFPAVRYPGDNYDTYQHVEFLRAKSAADNDYMGYSVGVVGALRLTSPNDSNTDIGKFEMQKPMCIEWEFDAAGKFAQGWVNAGGPEQSGQTAHGDPDWQLPMNRFAHVYFGLVVITDTTPAMHVWLDELVLDTKRVGCD